MSYSHALPIRAACQSECSSCSCRSDSDLIPTQVNQSADPGDALLDAPDQVLSTLRSDGSRRWLNPKLSTGKWWHRRRWVAYVLMVVFVAIPHLRVGGKPLILLDIAAREFTVLGKTFLPTDTMVLALLMLSVFLTIVLVTAITGRAWCGWACPQTVYMEFLFRPIDRFFGGTTGKGGTPKRDRGALASVLRIVVYVALCMFLAHTFLAYFVGTEKLALWIRSSPIQHPAAFLVMAGTTVAMLFDFLFFREQTCLIACPYGRFQSVMLDRQSMIVAYDPVRGEPREKGKRAAESAAGDCVDCNQCVVVCPTGIDIRDGLQMECINCTQCIDACDNVMARVGLPTGLIRFSSQDAIDRKPVKMARARTVIYPLILVTLLTGFGFAISSKSDFDARVIRGKGAPFASLANKTVANSFAIRLVNRTDRDRRFDIQVAGPDIQQSGDWKNVTLQVVDTDQLSLTGGQSVLIPVTIKFPAYMTLGDGNQEAMILVKQAESNGDGATSSGESAAVNSNEPVPARQLFVKLLGPR